MIMMPDMPHMPPIPAIPTMLSISFLNNDQYYHLNTITL